MCVPARQALFSIHLQAAEALKHEVFTQSIGAIAWLSWSFFADDLLLTLSPAHLAVVQ